MPFSTLPKDSEGYKIYEEVYTKALKEYNNDKEKAARTAWSAVKGAGFSKDESGKWVKKSGLAEFSMTITKASFDKSNPNEPMRFRAVASDTDADLYDEKMSQELFQDFTNRIENDVPIPEAFKSALCEENWCGGLPYPSIAHYRSAANNVPGKIDSVYVDGNRLKSTGILNDTDLGRAVFKSLCDDLYNKKSGVDKDPVRVSIGFLDLQHSHIGQGMNYKFERKSLSQICPMCSQGIGGKVYQKGILVHEAFTRVPVNPRTEAEVMKAMTDDVIKTKKDDAASIVGELAESLVDKSQTSILTTKANDPNAKELTSDVSQGYPADPREGHADEFEHCYDPDTGSWDQECIDMAMMGHFPKLRYDMQMQDTDHRPDMDDGRTANTVSKSMTKSEGDGNHPASHYLVVEDPEKPTTWHLRVKDSSGKIDTRLLGAAHAALTKGYRGNKYEGPQSGKAMAKLRNLYKSAGLDWPEEEKSMVQKGKIPEAPLPEGMEKRVPFEEDEDELYPEVTDKETNVNPAKRGSNGMNAPAGDVQDVNGYGDMKVNGKMIAKKAKAYQGKETPEEEEMEDEEKGKKEKALRSTARSLVETVESLKSQGVVGDEALRAVQEVYNKLGAEIQRSFTTQSVSGGEMAEIIRAAVQDAVAPLQQELAVLKAQNGQVTRSRNPMPRSLTVTPLTNSLMQKSGAQIVGDQTSNLTAGQNQPFSQIRALAHKSVVGQ